MNHVTRLMAEARVMKPSTLRFFEEAGLGRILNLQALHGYIYLRWIEPYVALSRRYLFPLLGPWSARLVAEGYHSRVLSPDQARSVIEVNREIPLQDLEQVLPYSRAREILLSNPREIALFECTCRASRESPCEPTQVCMAVGQPFVDFVVEHHPDRSRRVSCEEALEVLREEHERGHMQTAWFKDACLDRFYAICNCCRCCCVAVEGARKAGIPFFTSSGHVARVDPEGCQGCGHCADPCPFDALSVEEVARVSWERCMGCGVCVARCPHGALSLVRDEAKGPVMDVEALG